MESTNAAEDEGTRVILTIVTAHEEVELNILLNEEFNRDDLEGEIRGGLTDDTFIEIPLGTGRGYINTSHLVSISVQDA